MNTEVALESGVQLTAQRAASLTDDAFDDVECEHSPSSEVNVAEKALGAGEGGPEGGSQEHLAGAEAFTPAAITAVGTIDTEGESSDRKFSLEIAGLSSGEVVELSPRIEGVLRDHGSSESPGKAVVAVLPDSTIPASNGKASLALDDAGYGPDANDELGETDEGSARDCDDAEDDVGETTALITTAVQT